MLRSLAFALLLVGCSSFGTTSDNPSPPAGDSGPGSSVDGGLVEGGLPPPAPGTFCAGHLKATFCSDFDGLDPFMGWLKKNAGEPNSDYRIDTSIAASPPNAARLSIRDSGSPDAVLQYSSGKSTNRIEASFRVYLDKYSERKVFLVKLLLGSDKGSFVGLKPQGLLLEGGNDTPIGTGARLTEKTWLPVKIVADARAGKVTVEVNGVFYTGGNLALRTFSSVSLNIGPAEPATQEVDPWIIFYDDVVLDLE